MSEDLNYRMAILDGSWPQSVEILTRALENAKALKGPLTMIDNIDWQVVTCAYGSEELPEDLKAILRKLDIVIKDANGLSFSPRESFGLKSTQVLSLVILLYKMGLLKGPKDDG